MVSAASHSSPGISFVPGNVMRHSSQPFNQFPAPDLSSTLHQTILVGLSPVLMIDDDREFCALIRDYLEPFGYRFPRRTQVLREWKKPVRSNGSRSSST